MTHEQDILLLRRTIDIAERAFRDGNHPFGALLADGTGNIIMEAENAFSTQRGPGHAESVLARRAALAHSPEELAEMTLYTSIEPCAMCAGTIYWAGIGAVVYGASEKRLLELTGNNDENPTMDLPCRAVFAAGQRKIEVRGPFPELEAELIRIHEEFWR